MMNVPELEMITMLTASDDVVAIIDIYSMELIWVANDLAIELEIDRECLMGIRLTEDSFIKRSRIIDMLGRIMCGEKVIFDEELSRIDGTLIKMSMIMEKFDCDDSNFIVVKDFVNKEVRNDLNFIQPGVNKF